jgi:hypothetical protein
MFTTPIPDKCTELVRESEEVVELDEYVIEELEETSDIEVVELDFVVDDVELVEVIVTLDGLEK